MHELHDDHSSFTVMHTELPGCTDSETVRCDIVNRRLNIFVPYRFQLNYQYEIKPTRTRTANSVFLGHVPMRFDHNNSET